jgi:hypothetical protein
MIPALHFLLSNADVLLWIALGASACAAIWSFLWPT